MPTKTKPKKPTQVWMFRVTFEAQEREEIIDLLGLDALSADEQNVLIEALEFELMHHFNRLARLPDRPMPAHIAAELKKMLFPAQKLLQGIDPNRLTHEARSALPDVDTGTLWYQLTYLITDAKLAIEKLSKAGRKSDGGALNQWDSEVRQNIQAALEQFFDKNNRTLSDKTLSSEDYRADFVELCMKKMPISPSGKPKKS